MANIFRVYKDSQVTTDRIRAEAAADSIVTPERVVYVFGTADDVAPNFTTVDGALTYANSLTPIVTEPVVIRLFTKADGTPYTLVPDEFDEWTVYANMYIYFVSDFVRLNETTTLPTTLPEGLTVWYRDGNDVEYLYVGNTDGDAQLIGGKPTAEEIRDELETLTGDDRLPESAIKKPYLEYYALLTNDGGEDIQVTVINNDFPDPVVASYVDEGYYAFTCDTFSDYTRKSVSFGSPGSTSQGSNICLNHVFGGNSVNIFSVVASTDTPVNEALNNCPMIIRLYP